jgi:uncharacterized protein (TIGR03790 family)
MILSLLSRAVNDDTPLGPKEVNNEIAVSPGSSLPQIETSSRSPQEYSDLVSYDDVLLVRNLNSPVSMEIADYFRSQRNILPLNICNITTSTSETISRTNFDNEIRIPIEDYLTSNGLENTINFIVTTKGVPLRISEEDSSDDDWNNPITIDRASVDSELTLILGSYSMFIGGGGFMMTTPITYMQNPYFNASDDFSHTTYDIYLVTRLTGYDVDDIKAYIDKVPEGVGKKGTFVFDVDPGRDNPNYRIGNDGMRGANATLTAKGFDVILDETNTFLTNNENVSGYTSWGSNDGRYSVGSNSNYGFETDSNTDKIPDGWFFEKDLGNDQIDRNDTDKMYNQWSVRINRTTVNSNYSAVSQNVTIKLDTRYFLRGQVNVSSVTGGKGAHLRITAYDDWDQLVWEKNGTSRTGTTNNWISLNQIIFEPIVGISKLRVSAILSGSSGEAYFDDVRLIEIKPHNSWNPGTLVETYVSTSGRTFNYPTPYGQSLAADLILDGVSGTKGYVYEPYLSAAAHPDILFDEYTDGYFSAESYYMASEFLSWMDVVICDPKLAIYRQSLIPDLSISHLDITFSDSLPQIGSIIDIIANVHNLGNYTAKGITVHFYDSDPQLGGTFLGASSLDISASGQNQTSIIWDTSGYIGYYNITVFIDPDDVCFEISESNNNASSTIMVHTGYPNASAGSDDVISEDLVKSFDGSGSTDNSSIENYTWDFGDGEFGYGVNPSHTYTNSGIYNVTLNVTNDYGLSDLDTVVITVNNVVPTAEAGNDIFDFEGVEIFFDGSSSTDSPSDIPTLNYTWDFKDGHMGYGMNPSHTYSDDGIYLVTLQVRDDDGAIDSVSVTVTLDNVAPNITELPSQTIFEDELAIMDIDATDVPGDSLFYSDNTSLFEINPLTGIIAFTPGNEDVGIHFVRITVEDDDGGSSFIDIRITIENTNDPPIITSQPGTEATEGTVYEYYVIAIDDDLNISVGEQLFYSLDEAPTGMIIDSDGRISWVPGEDYVSQSFDITVNVTDGEEFDVQTFQLYVNNVNDPPNILSDPVLSVNEDSEYLYDVEGEDEDAIDVLSYSLDEAPEGMVIDPTTGEISWTPGNDDAGDHEIVINVTDLAGDFAVQEFTLSVVNVNDAPILSSIGNMEVNEDEAFTYFVNASDIDLGDSLKFYDDTDLFNIDRNTGEISFTPTNDDVGVYTIVITVKDQSGSQDAEEIILTVVNENDPPTITFSSVYSIDEDESFTMTVEAEDEDIGDSLSFSDDTTMFDIDSQTGEISFTPSNADVGSHQINISVMDKDGAVAYKTLYLTIRNVNDPPEIDRTEIPNPSVPIEIKHGDTYELTVEVDDPDPDESLTFSDDTDLFDIDPETGEIVFTPGPDDAGLHEVKITVTDSEGETDEIHLTFDIEGQKEEGGLDLILLILPFIVAVVVVIILIILFMGKKKKSQESVMVMEPQTVYPENQQYYPPPPPPSQ